MVDERAHLELADRHIRESRDRIAAQEALVLSLGSNGHDTTDAEAILVMFRASLMAMLDHRVLIVEAIDRQATAADPADPS